MPVETTLQESHRAYIRAVAAALTQAGITVTDVDFFDDLWNDTDPHRRCGVHIDVVSTAAAYSGRELWVAWSDECGWTLYVFAPAADRIESAHPLCAEVLPAPADLVAAVVPALSQRPAPVGRQHPVRRSSAGFDEALEDGLDTYTRKSGPTT
jgi:hypothetical protein